jgi:hypothetical protein
VKPITIEDALEQAPFKPFQFILDSGKTVRVQHPDCLLFNGQKTVCVVAEGEHIRVLDVDHLTGLTYKNIRSKNGSKPSERS